MYIDITQIKRTLVLPPKSLAFTICQVPVIYSRGGQAELIVTFADGRTLHAAGSRLDIETSRSIFERNGQVVQLQVTVPEAAVTL